LIISFGTAGNFAELARFTFRHEAEIFRLESLYRFAEVVAGKRLVASRSIRSQIAVMLRTGRAIVRAARAVAAAPRTFATRAIATRSFTTSAVAPRATFAAATIAIAAGGSVTVRPVAARFGYIAARLADRSEFAADFFQTFVDAKVGIFRQRRVVEIARRQGIAPFALWAIILAVGAASATSATATASTARAIRIVVVAMTARRSRLVAA